MIVGLNSNIRFRNHGARPFRKQLLKGGRYDYPLCFHRNISCGHFGDHPRRSSRLASTRRQFPPARPLKARESGVFRAGHPGGRAMSCARCPWRNDCGLAQPRWGRICSLLRGQSTASLIEAGSSTFSCTSKSSPGSARCAWKLQPCSIRCL